jgi:hypothetical protein
MKLIKDTLGYHIKDLDGYKLSLKNCEAIANGYDLDELAEKEFPLDYDIPLFETLSITEKSHKSILIGMLQGTLQKGFQKALELLSDKKFSEEDVSKVVTHVLNELVLVDGFNKQYLFPESIYQETTTKCKSLQQTQWDVEVVMKNVIDETKIVGAIKGVKGSGNKITTYKQIPKLDADGCLILKRI